MTIIELYGAEAIAAQARELAEVLEFKVNPTSGVLTHTEADSFFLYTENGQAISQLPGGQIYAIPKDYQTINKEEQEKIRIEVNNSAHNLAKLLRKHHLKFDIVPSEKTEDRGMGDEYLYAQKISVNPTQPDFFKNADKLVKALRLHNRIEAAKSALLKSGFAKDARPLKMLAAAEVSQNHKILGGLITRWHRLCANRQQFRLAQEMLFKRGFIASEQAIAPLDLAA